MQQRSYQAINLVGSSQTNCYMQLWFGENPLQVIACTPSQEFYVVGKGWQAACQLQSGQYLLRDHQDGKGEAAILTKVVLVKKTCPVYMLEVVNYHTFLVGANAIVTHNMPLGASFVFELAMAFGEGAAAGATVGSYFGPVTIGVGASLLGLAGVGYYLLGDSNKTKYRLSFDSELVERLVNCKNKHGSPKAKKTTNNKKLSFGSGGKGPKKDHKKGTCPIPPIKGKKDENSTQHVGPNGTYKGVGYHGKKGNNMKGAAPKNGQKALDNSHLYKEKGNTDYQRRIAAVDEEFVILDETGNKQFHGHTRPWHDLDDEMQTLLRKEGLVNSKGKFL